MHAGDGGMRKADLQQSPHVLGMVMGIDGPNAEFGNANRQVEL